MLLNNYGLSDDIWRHELILGNTNQQIKQGLLGCQPGDL